MQNNLLAIRLHRKFKRIEVAEALGVVASTIYRWEMKPEKHAIPEDMLFALARFYEVAITDIKPAYAEVLTQEPILSRRHPTETTQSRLHSVPTA